MTNYITKPLGEMYKWEEVTVTIFGWLLFHVKRNRKAYTIRSICCSKCILYAAERNQILEHNPCAGISGKGGKTGQKEGGIDRSVGSVSWIQSRGFLHIYLLCSGFVFLGLVSGKVGNCKWDCVFLDEDTPIYRWGRRHGTEHNTAESRGFCGAKDSGGKRGYSDTEVFVGLCLRETERKFHIPDYVVVDSKGEPLAASQFQSVVCMSLSAPLSPELLWYVNEKVSNIRLLSMGDPEESTPNQIYAGL